MIFWMERHSVMMTHVSIKIISEKTGIHVWTIQSIMTEQPSGGTVYNCNPETTAADKIGPGQTTQTGFLMRKYFDESWNGDVTQYGNNVPLARYADVLMMYLEAEMEAGTPITQKSFGSDDKCSTRTSRHALITETNPIHYVKSYKKNV